MWKRLKAFWQRSRQALGIPVLTFIAGGVCTDVLQAAINDKLLKNTNGILVLIMACLVAIGFLIRDGLQQLEEKFVQHSAGVEAKSELLLSRIDSVLSQVGLRVQYLEYRGGQDSEVLFRELRQIIEAAKKNIVIVNSFLAEKYVDGQVGQSTTERRNFYDSLLTRVRETGVSYQRIVQIDDNDTLRRLLTDREYLRHFHQMLDEHEKNKYLVSLIKAEAARPFTFTIVDARWLMLGISERSGLRSHMRGVFIFDDPQQILVPRFLEFATAIANRTKGSIRKSELPPILEADAAAINPAPPP